MFDAKNYVDSTILGLFRLANNDNGDKRCYIKLSDSYETIFRQFCGYKFSFVHHASNINSTIILIDRFVDIPEFDLDVVCTVYTHSVFPLSTWQPIVIAMCGLLFSTLRHLSRLRFNFLLNYMSFDCFRTNSNEEKKKKRVDVGVHFSIISFLYT